MAEENIIRDSKAAKKQNDLPVEVSLGEGRASNDLKEEIVCLELHLAWPDLNDLDVLSQAWLCHQHTFCSTKSDLIGTALIKLKPLIDKLAKLKRNVSTPI